MLMSLSDSTTMSWSFPWLDWSIWPRPLSWSARPPRPVPDVCQRGWTSSHRSRNAIKPFRACAYYITRSGQHTELSSGWHLSSWRLLCKKTTTQQLSLSVYQQLPLDKSAKSRPQREVACELAPPNVTFLTTIGVTTTIRQMETL